MPDLNVIPIFVAVVEQGSFSGAAKALGLSKSAVSKRVTKLEADLGVRLLHRTTRSLQLTEPGEQYFNHAQDVMKSAQQAADHAVEWQHQPKGVLRLSLPMSLGRLHIAPLITEFLAAFPDLTIELNLNDAWSDLIVGRYDVAIRMGPLPDSEFVARKFAAIGSVLCASPAYVHACGQIQTPQALQGHNCLLFSHHTVVNEWVFERAGKSTTVTVNGNLEANNSEALTQYALDGLGIARLPRFAVLDELATGRLLPLLSDYAMPSRDAYWVYPMKTYIPQKVNVFVDFVTNKLADDFATWL